jgi:hypothetical protein
VRQSNGLVILMPKHSIKFVHADSPAGSEADA